MSDYKFKTTNIKGKQYVEVNERIKYFRQAPEYKGWSLNSEIITLDAESCVVRAEIRDDQWVLRATGYAQEDKSSSYINKTSYVENCETSAWGRALANLGIGIDTSIASSNEVAMAVAKQSLHTEKKGKDVTPAKAPAKSVKEEPAKSSIYDMAVVKLGENPTQAYYDQIMTKAGDKFTEAEKKELLKLVK